MEKTNTNHPTSYKESYNRGLQKKAIVACSVFSTFELFYNNQKQTVTGAQGTERLFVYMELQCLDTGGDI